MLFESYFNKVLQVSDEIQKMLADSFATSKYEFTDRGISINVPHKEFPMIVKFTMQPDKADDAMFADMINYTSSRRKTIQIKSGQKRRRILPVKGGKLNIYTANLAAEYRNQIPFFNQLKPYIQQLKKNSFAFHNLNAAQFAEVCAALLTTAPFKGTITHEIQHNYNPIAHQKVIPAINAKHSETLSKYAKYATRDDEVNSSIAEAVAYVQHNNADGGVFNSQTPKLFVDECIAFLVKIGRWRNYTEDIKRKVMRRLSQTFYDMRQPSQA